MKSFLTSLSRRFAIPTLLVLSALVDTGSVARSSTEEEASLTTLLNDCRSLAPAPTGLAVRDRTARIGHLELDFEDGVLFPLKTATGAAMGVFFEGRGHYLYRTEDPGDRQVLALNLSRHTRVPAFHDPSVGDSFLSLDESRPKVLNIEHLFLPELVR